MNVQPQRRLPELLSGLAQDVPDVAVAGVETDSRRVTPGAAFLACAGLRGHGLDFAAQALAHGAAAVAWEPGPDVQPPQLPVPSVAVPGLGRAAGEIAARWHGRPSERMTVIGVTGTDGKSSTAFVLAQALDALGRPCAYFGTLGYGRVDALAHSEHTTPDAVALQRRLAEALQAGATACAMEVSSHALELGRVGATRFTVAVLTNIGRDHLDFHGDDQAYAAAKRKLFDSEGLRCRVLNMDDATGREWARDLSDVITYALEHPADVSADAIETHEAGLRFRLRARGSGAPVSSALFGRFNIYNLLAAAAVLLALDVPLADAASALSSARTVPGRMEGFRAPGGPLVIVDYAHTPQALAAALNAAGAHCRGQLICVFGCGGDRDRGKRPLMGAAAARIADRLYVTDDNPRTENPARIIADVLDGLPPESRDPGSESRIQVIHDRAQAITAAIRGAGPDDVVLVAGKGHENYQIVGTTRRPYSDRATVQALLQPEASA